jgi:molybdate transport system substrate-binding protein
MDVLVGKASAIVLAGLALALSLVGCGGEQDDTLTVLAASSLTDAFGELGKTFEERNPGVEIRQSFESSTTLLAQIRQGAPADVFASAAEEEMDAAVEDGLVAGDPEVFVRNREVIMVPQDNPAEVRSLRDLAQPGVKLVLAEEGVPAADYAVEILGNANAKYGSDFKQDVRDRVEVIAIPEDLNIVATYPIAALKDAQNPELAREWVNLVVSEEGQSVLEEWGFEPATG